MSDSYKYAGDTYDNKVQFLPQNGGIKREATTYSMVTTMEGDNANIEFNAKTTDTKLMISELSTDLVNADRMVQQTRLERDIYLQAIEKIASVGKITNEQFQMIINEIGTQLVQLVQEQSGKRVNK